MAGSFANDLTTEALRKVFQTVDNTPVWMPSRNVGPAQPAPIIRADSKTGRRYLDLMLWGLVPHWSKDMSRPAPRARAETVATNGMFWAAFRARRCLVPASAFYENAREPRAFALRDRQPMALAGIWESWEHEGDVLHSFALISAPAEGNLHLNAERLPVVITAAHYEDWLMAPRSQVHALLRAPTDDMMVTWRLESGRGAVETNGDARLQRTTA